MAAEYIIVSGFCREIEKEIQAQTIPHSICQEVYGFFAQPYILPKIVQCKAEKLQTLQLQPLHQLFIDAVLARWKTVHQSDDMQHHKALIQVIMCSKRIIEHCLQHKLSELYQRSKHSNLRNSVFHPYCWLLFGQSVALFNSLAIDLNSTSYDDFDPEKEQCAMIAHIAWPIIQLFQDCLCDHYYLPKPVELWQPTELNELNEEEQMRYKYVRAVYDMLRNIGALKTMVPHMDGAIRHQMKTFVYRIAFCHPYEEEPSESDSFDDFVWILCEAAWLCGAIAGTMEETMAAALVLYCLTALRKIRDLDPPLSKYCRTLICRTIKYVKGKYKMEERKHAVEKPTN